MHILLTNDDGIFAPGLEALKDAMLAAFDRVTIVAPQGQRSAASHSMTIGKNLYCREYGTGTEALREISVSGTPVDCVKMAMEYFLHDQHPDLIISGINDGYNLGSDVLYSGTVSAAMEGPYYQIPAMAVSMGDMTKERCRQTARLAVELTKRIFMKKRFPGILNVNIPPIGNISLQNAEVVPQTVQIYRNVVEVRHDIDGGLCYALTGHIDFSTAPDDTDVGCIRRGRVALTPLCWRQTATAAMDYIREGLEAL